MISLCLALLLLPSHSPADTTRAKLAASITDATGIAPPIGEISGLAIDPQGRVYVTDLQEPRILVFSPEGRLVATIGRKGQGPGEFSAPTGPVFGPDGALYVRNMERVQRFVALSSGGIVSKYDRIFDGPVMAPWRSKLPSAIDQAGRFYFPLEVGLADGLTHYAYRRCTLDGRCADSIPVPVHPTTRSSWASAEVSPGTGRILRGLNVVPFHPTPQWTITPRGTILSTAADRPAMIETDTRGATVRTFNLPGAAVAISSAERAESLRALTRRLDSVPVPLSQVRGMSEEVKSKKLPAVFPLVRGLFTVGNDVWAMRWSSASQRSITIFDVIGPQGALLRTVTVPVACQATPVPAVAGGTIACVTVDPESGEEGLAISRM